MATLAASEARPQNSVSNSDYAAVFMTAVVVAMISSWILLQAVLKASPSEMNGLTELMTPVLKFSIVLAPMAMLLKIGLQCLVIWLVASVAGQSVTARATSFRLLTIAPLLEIPNIIDGLSLYVRGGTIITAHVPLGLDLLLTLPQSRLTILLYAINIVTIIWGAILTIMLKRSFGLGTVTASIATIAAWLMTSALPLLLR